MLAIFILRWRTPILFVRVAELDDTGGWAVFRSHHRRCDEHYKWSLVLRIRIKRASTRLTRDKSDHHKTGHLMDLPNDTTSPCRTVVPLSYKFCSTSLSIIATEMNIVLATSASVSSTPTSRREVSPRSFHSICCPLHRQFCRGLWTPERHNF